MVLCHCTEQAEQHVSSAPADLLFNRGWLHIFFIILFPVSLISIVIVFIIFTVFAVVVFVV